MPQIPLGLTCSKISEIVHSKSSNYCTFLFLALLSLRTGRSLTNQFQTGMAKILQLNMLHIYVANVYSVQRLFLIELLLKWLMQLQKLILRLTQMENNHDIINYQ